MEREKKHTYIVNGEFIFHFYSKEKKTDLLDYNARQPRRSIAENVVRQTAGRTSLRFRSANRCFSDFFPLSRYRSKTGY